MFFKSIFLLCVAIVLLLLTPTVGYTENDPASIHSRLFPRGDLFLPLLADPQQFMFRVSAGWLDASFLESYVAYLSAGESFGIVRLGDTELRNGWQIDIAGGGFAQFDLNSKSFDFVNVDFSGAIPITFRRDSFSGRFQVSHVSTHLGDEFLLNHKLTRINFSYEALTALIGFDTAKWRLYAGGEYLMRTDPKGVKAVMLQSGLEYRQNKSFFNFGFNSNSVFFAALDVKFWEEFGFEPSISVKSGFEFSSLDDPDREGRVLRFLLEAYRGISPFGQFFSEEVEVTMIGLGLQLNL